ncbi:hypothetical protein V8E54_011506 [Elaphomyces granulatus]
MRAHHPQMRTTGSIPGRHSGPNAVDERLIGRMKKLNLDGAPRSIDNVRSPFEQDLILDLPPFDHNPISVYRGYTLFRNRRMFGESPHWGPEITPRPMNLHQEELRTMILRGKKKKGSLSQKLNEIGESKRAHLDNLTKLHNRNDDRHVEWSLAYLDLVMGQEVRGTGGGRFTTFQEIKSIDIILVRKPKAGVSSNQFYSPSAPFGRNSSEDFIDLRPKAKEYRPPNPDVKPKEMAGPGRDTGLPSRTREYRDDFDAPEGKPFKEKSGQGRDSGFVQLSPPRAGEYRPPHPGDDFDAPEPKAFKEKSGQGRDPAFDRAREYHPPEFKEVPGFDQFPPPRDGAKQPQKSYRDETANPHREQSIRRRENQPIPVLHTHSPRLDYPSEKFCPRGFQERRDERTLAARDELRELELRGFELRGFELRQYLLEKDKLEKFGPRDFQERRDERTLAARDQLRQYLLEKDKLEEMTQQQLRSKMDHYNRYGDDPRHNPRLAAYREPNMRHDCILELATSTPN